MTINNKILTVSYGTFSCTLEGFDDSFGTMKAIAEYFRDLAADDRYFGAEPPQPDAEMLTRIAEREISRRVQAREHEGRIVLSASEPAAADTGTAAAPLATATAVVQAASDSAHSAPAEQDDFAAEDGAEDTGPDVAVTRADDSANGDVAPPTETAADVTTAPLEVPQEGADAVAEDVAPHDAEDNSIADVGTAQDEAEAVDAADGMAQTAEAETDATDFFAGSDDAPEAETEADTLVAETVEPAPAPLPADSIAAKLQRIRAVVSQSQQDAAEEELFEDEHAEDVVARHAVDVMAEHAEDVVAEQAEDVVAEHAGDVVAEHAGDVVAEHAGDVAQAEEDVAQAAEAVAIDGAVSQPASEDVVADAARDIEDAFEIDDAASADADVSAGDEDELSALLARIDTRTSTEQIEEMSEPSVDVADTDDTAGDDMGLDTLAALMAADQDDDAQDDDAGDTGENLFDTTEETDAEDEDDIEADAGVPDAIAEQPAHRVRVVKVKRADIDAALASGELEEVEDDEIGSTLSPDEEAELMAELAQVEAELQAAGNATKDDTEAAEAGQAEAAQDDHAPEAFAQDEAAPVADPAIAAETKATGLQDKDVARLMAEAENQMEEPEGTNRRDAFAHLKAAVKAKKADADIGSDSIKDEGAFRSDLADVVKPRRPELGSQRAERPDTPRPAPLKLVAEQRVDIDKAPKGPVRPRRVAAAPELAHDAQSAASFEDYVNELGAHDLPALLEAAASYLSFVEGRDEFSRPQLMTKVRQVEKEDFSREDGLRSFGQLLRAGKIEKISGGRFAVTNDIGYRPEHRAAG